MTDEARLLAHVSNQLADLQASVTRLERGAEEFVPHLRQLVTNKAVRAAGAAATMFRRGQ